MDKIMDKAKIEQQAKQIMDAFLNALGNGEHLPYEVGTERPAYMREYNIECKKENQRECKEEYPRESKDEEFDKEFSSRMLKNAPKTRENQIVAEKKKW